MGFLFKLSKINFLPNMDLKPIAGWSRFLPPFVLAPKERIKKEKAAQSVGACRGSYALVFCLERCSSAEKRSFLCWVKLLTNWMDFPRSVGAGYVLFFFTCWTFFLFLLHLPTTLALGSSRCSRPVSSPLGCASLRAAEPREALPSSASLRKVGTGLSLNMAHLTGFIS